MTRLFAGERTLLSPALVPVKRGLRRLAGVDGWAEQHWVTAELNSFSRKLTGSADQGEFLWATTHHIAAMLRVDAVVLPRRRGPPRRSAPSVGRTGRPTAGRPTSPRCGKPCTAAASTSAPSRASAAPRG